MLFYVQVNLAILDFLQRFEVTLFIIEKHGRCDPDGECFKGLLSETTLKHNGISIIGTTLRKAEMVRIIPRAV